MNHYMQSFVLQDPSLTATEVQHNNQILGSLPADIATLCKTNDELQHTLHYTQKECDEARRTLNNSCQDYDNLQDDYNNLQEESNCEIDDLHQHVSDLKRQATPQHHKVPR